MCTLWRFKEVVAFMLIYLPNRVMCLEKSRYLAMNWPLQASVPSFHVCSTLGSSALPHFLNQVPPKAQQEDLPDFLFTPHLEHAEPIVTVMHGKRERKREREKGKKYTRWIDSYPILIFVIHFDIVIVNIELTPIGIIIVVVDKKQKLIRKAVIATLSSKSTNRHDAVPH